VPDTPDVLVYERRGGPRRKSWAGPRRLVVSVTSRGASRDWYSVWVSER
jgi:hypothetical protein